MSNFNTENVVSVHHWTDRLFSFRTTRTPSFRFRSGQFIMMGVEAEGRPLVRAYSLASATYEDELEFFSVKVPDGPLTSRLQHLEEGDSVLVGRKPTGTLAARQSARRAAISSCSAPAPASRPTSASSRTPRPTSASSASSSCTAAAGRRELAYGDYLSNDLPNDEFVGEYARRQLVYYPTVTREPFRNHGRISLLLTSGKLTDDLGLPAIDRATDRFMLCGSPAMLADLRTILEARGFEEGNHGAPGDFVIEKAFVEK